MALCSLPLGLSTCDASSDAKPARCLRKSKAFAHQQGAQGRRMSEAEMDFLSASWQHGEMKIMHAVLRATRLKPSCVQERIVLSPRSKPLMIG